jgi:hypothetical protein
MEYYPEEGLLAQQEAENEEVQEIKSKIFNRTVTDEELNRWQEIERKNYNQVEIL